jgi:hypothetical protein
MSRSLRSVWVLAAAVVLLVAGCGTSADPDTWAEAEEDARYVDDEAFPAQSAVEYNFMRSCVEANSRTLTEPEARVLCQCSFRDLRNQFTLDQFKSLDSALRENPNPSDLDDDPEDLWDDTAEGILRACAERVDS